MNFFSAWSEYYKESLIPLQTFSLNIKQERQFVDWYMTPETLQFAVDFPGQIYIIGDEPDQFCMRVEEYAEIYYSTMNAIRAIDSTAKFSPAGFAEPNETCSLGDKYEVHSIGYAEKFYKEYVRKFGSPPPVYEWRFHDFALNNPDGEVEEWWVRVNKMADWSIAHGAKMYLGSWGFLGWKGDLTNVIKETKYKLINDHRITGACWWSYDAWIDSSHPLFENGNLTLVGQSYLNEETAMTIEERIVAIEQAIGMEWANTHPVEGDLIPANTLPSGRYPLILSDYQIRLGIAKIETGIAEKIETKELIVDGNKVTIGGVVDNL